MSTPQIVPPLKSIEFDAMSKIRSQYGCGPIEFVGAANALYERHLVFDNVERLTVRRWGVQR